MSTTPKIVAEHFDTELVIRERFGRNRDLEFISHKRKAHAPSVTLAFALIERWGMVAGTPDGEDSTGRARLRLMTPAELVARAFDAAQLAHEEVTKRGLEAPVPSYPEIMREEEGA